MTTASSSLASAHLGSQVAWRLLWVLVSSLGLLVLTKARSTLNFLNNGDVILSVAIIVLRTRR